MHNGRRWGVCFCDRARSATRSGPWWIAGGAMCSDAFTECSCIVNGAEAKKLSVRICMLTERENAAAALPLHTTPARFFPGHHLAWHSEQRNAEHQRGQATRRPWPPKPKPKPEGGCWRGTRHCVAAQPWLEPRGVLARWGAFLRSLAGSTAFLEPLSARCPLPRLFGAGGPTPRDGAGSLPARAFGTGVGRCATLQASRALGRC